MTGPSANDPLLARAESVFGRALQAVSDLDDQSIGRDRSLIVRVVLAVFVVAMLLGVLALFFSPVVTTEWEKLNTQILDLLKSIVLPLVTLVFGYYFGKSGK